MTRIKICCIRSIGEAQLAIRHGATALGLVSEMPSGPGVISEQRIAGIARAVEPPVATFLLTCRQDPAAIAEQQRRCATSAVQICDRLGGGTYADLRALLPDVRLIQVVHVTGPQAIDEALRVADQVDALLLDSGNQALAVKELGGTGRTHDWSVSAGIVSQVAVPVYLAGGLTPANVGAAVRQVRPCGVDVCSGVRTGGQLDEKKLERFVAEVTAAS